MMFGDIHEHNTKQSSLGNISSIKRQRVCRKFLEVSNCSRARQRKKLKSTKKCVARAKLFFAK